MDYPAICLLEKETNNKVFIVPSKEALINFAKSLKRDEQTTFDTGVAIFKSLLPESKEEITPSYLQSNRVSLHTVEVAEIERGMKKFEDWTLLNPSQYDVFFLMESNSVAQMEARDWNCVNEIVSINRGDSAPVKPKIH